MTVKSEVNLRNVQEQMEDQFQMAKKYARKGMLAYAGMWGLAYDWSKARYGMGMDLLEKAEKRGEEVERMFMDEFKKRRGEVEERVESVAKELQEGRETLEHQLDTIVNKVGLVKRAAMSETQISVKVETEVKMHEPFEGYDLLNAKEAGDRVAEMDAEQLKYMRVYEVANKNRVTVLREIDARLEELQPVVA